MKKKNNAKNYLRFLFDFINANIYKSSDKVQDFAPEKNYLSTTQGWERVA